MALPFQAESDESAKARVPAALRRVFVLEDLRDPSQRPGLLREHVFDFQDGMRMIVSREDWAAQGIKVHCSFSWFKPPASADVRPIIMERLRTVLGFTGRNSSVEILVEPTRFPQANRRGILHYLFSDDLIANTWN
jgi:hypothetical protein